jgi:hypothetical protein
MKSLTGPICISPYTRPHTPVRPNTTGAHEGRPEIPRKLELLLRLRPRLERDDELRPREELLRPFELRPREEDMLRDEVLREDLPDMVELLLRDIITSNNSVCFYFAAR